MGPAREGGGKWGGGARDQQAGQAASRRLLSGPSITPGAGRGGESSAAPSSGRSQGQAPFGLRRRL